ncbi:MAG: HlyD family secretion protein [Planctomycetaceae bacterium]|jgi:hypothetical protein|nr:HlyD family secretion protein [Planctomycetaceae bacterium]
MKTSLFIFIVTLSLGIGVFTGWSTTSIEAVQSFLNKIGLTSTSAHNSTIIGETHSHNDTEYAVIALSKQAIDNIGVTEGTLKLSTEESKTKTFHGIITEMPGRSIIKISTRISGVVREIHHQEGERISPRSKLFDIGFTSGEPIQAQAEYFSLLQKRKTNLEWIKIYQKMNQDVKDIDFATKRQYDNKQSELNALIIAQKATLRFLGFSEDDIKKLDDNCSKLLEKINNENMEIKPDELRKETLLDRITIRMPNVTDSGFNYTRTNFNNTAILVVDYLNVEKGQQVNAGDNLCNISNYSKLFAEGWAYAIDEYQLVKTYQEHRPVTIRIEGIEETIHNPLISEIKLLDNRVDPENRIFRFHAEIENSEIKNKTNSTNSSAVTQNLSAETIDADNQNPVFYHWKFKPGQRCIIEVEEEKFNNCYFVRNSAIAQEGHEYFIFVQDGESIWSKDGTQQLTDIESQNNNGEFQKRIRWKRQPVKILFQNEVGFAFAQSTDLYGAIIAMTGAAQLNDALNAGNGKLQSSCNCGNH